MSSKSMWRWVKTDTGRLLDVGILEDGSLHNPNGYPEDEVRAAIESAIERRHQRRSEAAKRAAETRRKRKERLVYEVVERLNKGGHLTPSSRCTICGRQLDDPESRSRGIGSDCWQEILGWLTPSAAEHRRRQEQGEA